jgi:DNA primase
VDVDRIRADHPIEQVVAAAGVDLVPRGRGYMGCCPFHDDDTASMSVSGVPDRFHCFGCGASGDVIDFVRRLHHLSFREAVDQLQSRLATSAESGPPAHRRPAVIGPELVPVLDRQRAHEVNALAWKHFSTPVATSFADHYLRHHRGIDLYALRMEFPGAPLVGSVGHTWTGLVDHLRGQGVSDSELLAMDLGLRTSRGHLVDALRDRIIVPVTDPAGRIDGFIGRDTSGDARAPKYRNPTRTATFDKGAALYRPTHHPVEGDASVVVVEGVLDALAVAAAAARTGQTASFAPCTANGVTVSDAQAAAVTQLHRGSIVLALDGDQAGAQGALRWLAALAFEHHRAAAVTRLPEGIDPADWLIRSGDVGLDAFRPADTCHIDAATPDQPGRELVQLSLARAREPIQDTIGALLPLVRQLRPAAATALLRQAEDEMTRSGWNPNGAFSRRLREQVMSTLRRGSGPATAAPGAWPALPGPASAPPSLGRP